ncbi:alpha/beta hydrolase [Cellulosimicrobium protaetiae]|uniref:Alpha/beta hydrolase n=1 Tax=Cellulosimicrobium protaetiae TaxID=2587808 RepID=A0A6M5UK59_9MICO|nr:alpha/beta hydrolase [Cellulosimicrobium protaetiae]
MPGVATPGSAREAVSPVLTLVRRAHRPARPVGSVVLVHGYNDYVFQDHVVESFAEAGWDALGVDLRRAGRSLRAGQVPHYVDDLRETAADLGVAVAAARRSPGPVVVHAHSTGGLVAALWAHAHRGAGGCDALVLDSPFLDLRASWVERTVGTRVIDAVGPWSPLTVVSSGPSAYTGHLLAERGGRWTFDTSLKRPEGVPVRAGWLRAVRQGHARVARGLDVACPVLVARADRSGAEDPTGPDREVDLETTDTVLDVAQIARLAPRLGRDVTELVVPGAVHDLTLSDDGPRATYLSAVLGWLDEHVRREAA